MNHGKSYRKQKRYTTLSSVLAKKTRRGKGCAAFEYSNIFYDSEGRATGIHFFKLPSLPSEIHRWCNLIKRQNNKDGFNIFSNTFFVTTILWKKILKRHFREGSCYQVLFPQKNYQVKTTTPKKEKKLLVIQQITVKSTLKRTQKTSLSITSPSALPVLNYEELMTKDV